MAAKPVATWGNAGHRKGAVRIGNGPGRHVQTLAASYPVGVKPAAVPVGPAPVHQRQCARSLSRLVGGKARYRSGRGPSTLRSTEAQAAVPSGGPPARAGRSGGFRRWRSECATRDEDVASRHHAACRRELAIGRGPYRRHETE
jgi:hypothetical protein